MFLADDIINKELGRRRQYEARYTIDDHEDEPKGEKAATWTDKFPYVGEHGTEAEFLGH